MRSNSRHQNHDKYKARIVSLLDSYNEAAKVSEPEMIAHNAKYLTVLISGYLEQAVKELLLHYATSGSRQEISGYIEKTWPTSKNMKTDNIDKILKQFNNTWSEKFSNWLKEKESRKDDINLIVSWRNRIAHGNELNTYGVSLVSVKDKFSTVRDLVSLIEDLVKIET